MVSRFYLIIVFGAYLLLAASSRAETFTLSTGETLNGQVVPATGNDLGVQVKLGEGQYRRVPWTSFSQEDLRKLVKIQKLQPFVEPFIEITPEERIKKTEVKFEQPPRLALPARQSLLGAMFSSGLGVFVMLLIYAGAIYAGYEVAIFRAQPPLLVCGLSAIPFLGIAAPILFLCLPTRLPSSSPAAEEAPPQPEAEAGVPADAAAAGADDANPMLTEGAAHPAGLRLAHSDSDEAKPELPPTVTYQRGQFTFNRRFFETKFPGFFGVVRRDADRDMVLVIKSARGEYVGQRISRIAASDLHLQVQRGQASEEVVIPFQEVQEIRLKHKDA